eukprot:9182854-Pyramimonas_sp.AAC.1
MLQDSDVCDDSDSLLAAFTLIVSVLPDDVQRHVWYAKGRWRQALQRAIAMREQAPPPPGWGLQAAGLQPNHAAVRNIIGQPSYDYAQLEAHAVLGDEPGPTSVPPTPGQPSGAQTPLQQGNLPVPTGPMTLVIGNPTSEVGDEDGCGLCEDETTILMMD